MKVKGALTALALSALSLTCVAGELIVHTISAHSKYNRETTEVRNGTTFLVIPYNNRNFGLGWRTDDGLIFGVYDNSYYRLSGYIGQELMLTNYMGGFVGLATGYDRPITPIAGLIVRIPVASKLSLRLVATPPVRQVDAALHAALSYRF